MKINTSSKLIKSDTYGIKEKKYRADYIFQQQTKENRAICYSNCIIYNFSQEA